MGIVSFNISYRIKPQCFSKLLSLSPLTKKSGPRRIRFYLYGISTSKKLSEFS